MTSDEYGVCIGALLVCCALSEEALAGAGAVESAVIEGVPQIIDGDTLDIKGNRIRLAGMNAPETGRSRNDQNGRARMCGRDAAAAMDSLVGGKTVRCAVIGEDDYGRAVAVCRAAGADVGAEMVGAGFALDSPSYKPSYARIEAEARAAGRGLHGRGTRGDGAHKECKGYGE